MKYFLLVFVILFSPLISKSQVFDWGMQASGTTGSHGESIFVDSNLNVYMTGAFSGTQDFQEGPGVFNVTSMSSTSAFVLKMDSLKNIIWFKQIPGTYPKVVVDEFENVYLNGIFSGTGDFDPGLTVSNLTTATSNYEYYILKLSKDGNFLWANKYPGQHNTTITTFNLGPDGYLYFTGGFKNTVDFDPGVGVANLTSAGQDDVVILKSDTIGNFVWAKKVGNSYSNYFTDVEFDSSGNLLLIGFFIGTLDFNPGTSTFNLTSASSLENDGFILKLDNNGNFNFAVKFGGTGHEDPWAIEIDQNDQIYMIGDYFGAADFDPTTGQNIISSTGSYSNYFLASYSATNGNLNWVKTMSPSNSNCRIRKLVIDDNSNIYLSGKYSGTIDIDFNPNTNNSITALYSEDAFSAKYNSNGGLFWFTKLAGNNGNGDEVLSNFIDKYNNYYACGKFTTSINIDMDPGTGSYNINSSNYSLLFAYKYENCQMQNVTNLISSCGPYTYNSNVISSNGIYSFPEVSSTGCDSVVTIDLTITNISSTSQNSTICFGDSIQSGLNYYNQNGTFIDTLTAASGCDSVVTLNLTVNTQIDTTISLIGNSISANQNSASYQWYDCFNDLIIFGETNQSIIPGQTGFYSCIVDLNNCVDTTICLFYNLNSITENTLNKINLFPNPSKGKTELFLISDVPESQVFVYDSKGSLMRTNLMKNGKLELDFTNESDGIYLIYVLTNKTAQQLKYIKE